MLCLPCALKHQHATICGMFGRTSNLISCVTSPADPSFKVTIPPSPSFPDAGKSKASPDRQAELVQEFFTRAPSSTAAINASTGASSEEYSFKVGSTRTRMRRGALVDGSSLAEAVTDGASTMSPTQNSVESSHWPRLVEKAAQSQQAQLAKTSQIVAPAQQVQQLANAATSPATAPNSSSQAVSLTPANAQPVTPSGPTSNARSAQHLPLAPDSSSAVVVTSLAATAQNGASLQPPAGARLGKAISGIFGMLKRGSPASSGPDGGDAAASTCTSSSSAVGTGGATTTLPDPVSIATPAAARLISSVTPIPPLAAVADAERAPQLSMRLPALYIPMNNHQMTAASSSSSSSNSKSSVIAASATTTIIAGSKEGCTKLVDSVSVSASAAAVIILEDVHASPSVSPRPRSASSPACTGGGRGGFSAGGSIDTLSTTSAAAGAGATFGINVVGTEEQLLQLRRVTVPALGADEVSAFLIGSGDNVSFSEVGVLSTATSTAAPSAALTPEQLTLRELSLSSAAAAEGDADATVAALAESFVSSLSGIVLEAFEVSKEQLAATLCADARRKRRLRALLQLRRDDASLNLLREASALQTTPPGDGVAVCASPLGAPVAAIGSATMTSATTAATDDVDDPVIAIIDEEEGPQIVCGKKLRVNDDGFRRLAREVAHLPAFLGLVLFQRAVEAALVDDAENAMLMLACVRLRSLAAATPAAAAAAGASAALSKPPVVSLSRQWSHLSPLDGIAAAAAAATAPTSGGSTRESATRMSPLQSRPVLTRSHSFGFNAPLGDDRVASPRLAYVHGCGVRQGSFMGLDGIIASAVAASTPMNASTTTQVPADASVRAISVSTDAAAINTAPYTGRITYPTSPEEAYVRRANDRVRATLRGKCLAGTISALDFLRVWSGALSDLPRTDRLIALLNPSPDPVLVHHGIETRTEIRRGLRATKRAAAAAVAAAAAAAAAATSVSVEPNVQATGIAGGRASAGAAASATAASGLMRRAHTSTGVPAEVVAEAAAVSTTSTTAPAAPGGGAVVVSTTAATTTTAFPPRHMRSGSIVNLAAAASAAAASAGANGAASKPPFGSAAMNGLKPGGGTLTGPHHSRFSSAANVADAAAEAAASCLAVDDAQMGEAVRLTRASLLELARKLHDAGISAIPRGTRLVPGPDFPSLHRVHMEDLAPCVESLVERHPDLAGYRDRPVPRARFLAGVLVSIYSSLPQGLSMAGVPLVEIRSSNLADSLWLCSTSSTVGMVPFSTRWNDRLQAEYEAAAAATRLADEKAEAELVSGGHAGAPRNARRSDFGLPGTAMGSAVGGIFGSLFGSSSSGAAPPPPSNPPATTTTSSLTAAGGGASRRDSFTTPSPRLMISAPQSSPPPSSGGNGGMLTPRNHRAAQRNLRLPDPDPTGDDKATVTLAAYVAHCDMGITNAMLERVYAGAPRPLMSGLKGRLCYEDFVWLACMQGERMAGPSQEYWTRCLDLDDDGVLGVLDMECAAQAKHAQLTACGSRNLATIREVMEIVMDAVMPSRPVNGISRRDIKRSGNGPLVFDMLVSLVQKQAGGKKDLITNPFAMGTHAM